MLQDKIKNLITPAIKALGLQLWACELHTQGKRSLLQIYIDGVDGASVSVDDCARVSREVSALLDVEDLIQTRYQLEVSTPGLDRALHTLSQFQRYVGSDIKIKLRVAKNNSRQLMGRLEKITDDAIQLMVNDVVITVLLSEIQKANLIVSD
ncbi:MAG TPA: ribosome maturation factor RimP [Coxiellaceae bacterium]|nr:ribosome maturation factor RimP [Coxiellaceae bacterium]